MTYFDSGYLAKCYVEERGSTEVRTLARERDRIACSEYGRLELHAALHRKLREGHLTRAELEAVFRQLERERAALDVASFDRARHGGRRNGLSRAAGVSLSENQ
jgi:hypothetical protein